MSTHLVSTYGDQATYTVELDDSGVVSVDGLPKQSEDELKYAVSRYIENGLSPVAALGKYVGSYSFVTDAASQDALS